MRIVAFVAAAFAVLRGVAAMSDLALGSWLSTAVVGAIALGTAYVRLRRLTRAFDTA